jgi:hypothetical protein
METFELLGEKGVEGVIVFVEDNIRVQFVIEFLPIGFFILILYLFRKGTCKIKTFLLNHLLFILEFLLDLRVGEVKVGYLHDFANLFVGRVAVYCLNDRVK